MSEEKKSLHSICRWTFNPGKGGFTPADMRPEWSAAKGFDTPAMIRLVKKEIAPRLPDNIVLGIEMHYDTEVNEKNAQAVVDASGETGLYLAMGTPGAHSHWAYGGIASLDPAERKAAEEFGARTVDLMYGTLRPSWHPSVVPTFVLWNGSWGYDVETPLISRMRRNARDSTGKLIQYEQTKGGLLIFAVEPKQNEGHPAMIYGTVGEVLHLRSELVSQYGISPARFGVNKEFGHSEMIGLDIISETDQELDAGAMVHMHLNSQGGKAGLLGGQGKYDIDNGAQITEASVSVAYLIQQAGYSRWKGHDMQTRAYDDVRQGIDRVVRSVLSWEACERAARELPIEEITSYSQGRQTAIVQDIMNDSVETARRHFKELYRQAA